MIRRAPVIGVLALAFAASAYGFVSPEAKQAPAQATPKAPPPSQHFRSRPGLKPPPVRIHTAAGSTAPGYIFLGAKAKVVQAGPLILDNRGQVVWFNPLDTFGVSDVKVQHYRGRPVISWWRGRAPMGVGSGYYAIYDNTYKLVARVRAGHGYAGDIHEFVITPRNTALFTIYHRIPVDLTSIGGPKEGRIFDGIVQEVAIPSGKVLFEWHSWPTIGLDESYAPPPDKDKGAKAAPDDYVHLNSIDIEPNGNLLVSARNTRAVYEISRKTKKVLWRLGGKKSDFKMGDGTTFAWQHDARRQRDRTITIFDNGAAPPVEQFSRVLVLRLNMQTKQATLVRSYTHPKKLLVPFEGNAQFLPNGHIFVGWGAVPYFTEFARNGRVLLDASFGKGTAKITGPNQDADTYRAFRFVWHGYPRDRPAAAVSRGKLYVSWNGTTEVRRWQLLSGSEEASLSPRKTVPKRGFETAISLRGVTGRAFAARALDRTGRVLATSRVVQASGR